ncbi:putative peroxidase [Helianthus debilis subsp. tardiflorus]
MAAKNTTIFSFFSTLIFFGLIHSNQIDALNTNYYDHTCPNVESTITSVVKKAMMNDPTVPAALLRMHFHDCFIRVTILLSLTSFICVYAHLINKELVVPRVLWAHYSLSSLRLWGMVGLGLGHELTCGVRAPPPVSDVSVGYGRAWVGAWLGSLLKKKSE